MIGFWRYAIPIIPLIAVTLPSGFLIGQVVWEMYNLWDREMEYQSLQRGMVWGDADRRNRRMEWKSLLLGSLERLLYVIAFHIGRWELVGLWLTLKSAERFLVHLGTRRGRRDVASRHAYELYLIGSGISLLHAWVAWRAFDGLNRWTDSMPALGGLAVLLGTWVLSWCLRVQGRRTYGH